MLAAKSEVQVDNDEVRVTEWRLTPGSATGHHTHGMDYVIVPVTSGEMTIVAPNGERTKAQLGVGKSYFRKAGEVVDVDGIKIVGYTNVAGRVAASASSLYARNLFSFIETMVDKKEKKLAVNWDDELVKATALTRDGAVVHPNFQPKS